MPQAANVISFPVDTGTTGFLVELSASADERLYAIDHRLRMIEAMLYYIRDSEELGQHERLMLSGVEQAITDCRAVAALHPVEPAA